MFQISKIESQTLWEEDDHGEENKGTSWSYSYMTYEKEEKLSKKRRNVKGKSRDHKSQKSQKAIWAIK